MPEQQLLEQVSNAHTVPDIWSLSRHLMANRLLSEYAESPAFLQTFDRLHQHAISGSDLDRLLATDLLVRLPAAHKKLAPRAERHLKDSLTSELPPLHILNNTTHLPHLAKPADIRENVALALRFSSGAWVEAYLLTSILGEQQSQRTREALIGELVLRVDNMSDLLEKLSSTSIVAPSKGNRVNDLASICQALTRAISANRQVIAIDPQSPYMLDKLAGALVDHSGKGPLLPKLESAAIALVRLLDEILTTEITLFVEADSYIVLNRVRRWWNVRSFPKELQFALRPIRDKLIGAITIRAKMGQKSRELLSHLTNIASEREQVSALCARIAESNRLSPEIDDWLHGKKRDSEPRSKALRRALQSVGYEDIDYLVGNLLLLSTNLLRLLELNDAEQALGTAVTIHNRVQGVALERRLRVEGNPGDL